MTAMSKWRTRFNCPSLFRMFHDSISAFGRQPKVGHYETLLKVLHLLLESGFTNSYVTLLILIWTQVILLIFWIME